MIDGQHFMQVKGFLAAFENVRYQYTNDQYIDSELLSIFKELHFFQVPKYLSVTFN